AQDPDTLWTIEADPIVVTGTRIPKAKSTLPASVSVIPRAAIEASGAVNALPIVAEHVPGVFLQRRGTTGFGVSSGSGGSVSIRGISGAPNTRVLVLIDGQPQFMGIFGHPIADAYMASDVERIEVIRGPASVLYGSNAMGGAIHLITRRPPEDGLRASLRASYGAYGTRHLGGTTSVRRGDAALFASVNHAYTDGVRTDREDAFRTLSGYLKGRLRLDPAHELSADVTLSDSRFHDPGPITEAEAPADARRDYLRGRASLSLDNTYEHLEGAVRLFYSFGDHDFSGGFTSTDFNAGLTVYQNLMLAPGRILTLGVDAKLFGGDARVQTPGGPVVLVDDERIREVDGYALWQQRLLGVVDVNAGVRLVTNTQYGTEWVPAFGATVRAAAATTLRASVARGFRSPVPLDLFIGPVANPDLQPERAWNAEIGLAQRLLAGTVRLEATVFRTTGDDLIQVVGGPGMAPMRKNVGAFTNTGLELQAEATLAPGWRLSAHHTYLHLDTPMLLAPEHDLHLSVHYVRERLRATLGGQWVDGLYTTTAGGGVQERYVLLNARMELRVRPGVDVFVEGENLLDQAYQIDYGYPMPGAGLFAGVQARL
ncbi:MAG: TonB-dependent receptor, partial [Bacteroidetes bacterium]